MCGLFENTARFVGEKLGWEYNEKEGKGAREFLEWVQHRIGRRPHYEYKSKKMIGNLPLVHINLGLGIHRAKGVIAIGASAHGAQVAVGDAAGLFV